MKNPGPVTGSVAVAMTVCVCLNCNKRFAALAGTLKDIVQV